MNRDLSTGYPQGVEDEVLDMLDPPDLFSGVYDDGDGMESLPGDFRAPGRAKKGLPGGEATPHVKDATVALPVSPEMRGALAVAARRRDLVTSGAEGSPADRVHAPTSLHYDGLAIDVRYARDFRRQAADYVAAGYRVLAEPTHLHVSFDPEGRRV